MTGADIARGGNTAAATREREAAGEKTESGGGGEDKEWEALKGVIESHERGLKEAEGRAKELEGEASGAMPISLRLASYPSFHTNVAYACTYASRRTHLSA
eukprot:3633969-Rhodomonas_salina.2